MSSLHKFLESTNGLSQCFAEDGLGGLVEATVIQIQHLEVPAGGEHRAEVPPKA